MPELQAGSAAIFRTHLLFSSHCMHARELAEARSEQIKGTNNHRLIMIYRRHG